jgi:drug/metabolite transporter (DMT)-like permease
VAVCGGDVVVAWGLGLLAQRTLTKAFQYLPAAQLVPLLYLSVPFSSLMGWLFWSQRFTSMMLYATVMIVAGICLITLPRRGDV